MASKSLSGMVGGMIGSWLLYVGFYVKTVLARKLRFCPPQGILTRIMSSYVK